MPHERRVVTPARSAGALALVALIALAVWLLMPPRGGIPGVLAPDSGVELVQGKFNFLEGPVGTADDGLYFTDLPINKVYRLDPNSEISVVREQSGKANGLVLTSDGGLLAAEMVNRRISRWSGGGTATTVTDSAGNKPYLAPNDLIANAQGGIYFTDPGEFSEPARTT